MVFLGIYKDKDSCIHKQNKIHPLTDPEKEKWFHNSQPLPLPFPKVSAISKEVNVGLSSNNSTLLTPIPLPLPPLARGIHNFSLEEVSVACQHFTFDDQCTSQCVSHAIHRAPFSGIPMASKKVESTMTSFYCSSQGLQNFLNQLNVIASLKHPQLCEVIGFHAREGIDQHLIVFEGLFHGSLDRILYGRSNVPSLDWNARMKIAISAAEGLAFLHEKGPFQAMYSKFSSSNIQVNKDFSAKLSGYGCEGHNPEIEFLKPCSASANLSETNERRRGLITPMSNVWSFGGILVELLIGKQDSHTCYTREHDIVHWSKAFLADESRLSLIMDPHLQGRFPIKAVQIIAKIALSCLHNDPSKRPTMKAVVKCIKSAHSIKYSCLFPLRMPSALKGQHI